MVHIKNCFDKKLKGSALKLFITISFIAIFLFSTFKINETHIYNKTFPQTSSSELIILSPENKTYTEPMTGYYPSSYGFENYKNGSIGLGIGFLDEYYSPISGINTDIKIIEEELDGHCNYLNLRDNQPEDNTWAIHYIEDPQSIGTIEFYNRFKSSSNGSSLKRNYLYFRDSNNITAFHMEINIHNGNLNYYDGTSYKLIANVNADVWYHHRIIFNCKDGTKGKFVWIIREENGIEINRISNIDFENNFKESTIDEIYFETQEEDYELETMWDAFGFSWDPDYIIGDNLKEGLLLSYINTTNLNWISYSLNGEANRTIHGNTTIPLKGNGKYSIQLFGTDLSGNNYKSDIRYFSFDTSDSKEDRPNIPIIPIVIILSVVGVTIPSSYMIIKYEKKKLQQKKGVKSKNSLRDRYIAKKRKRIEHLEALNIEKIEKKLISPPQTALIEEDNDEIITSDFGEYNLESLKEICNEWIDQCAMHKESFEGLGYSCFNCHTKYCVKCAYTLAEKNIGCIVCGKLIPIVFQKKKSEKVNNKKFEDTQKIWSNLYNIFESENLIEQINKGVEFNLTFFEKDFYERIERLELDETEKQAFLKDMASLTPKERENLINTIINKFKTFNISKNGNNELKTGLKSSKLERIFKSENLLEEINKGVDIKLTCFEKDFYKKIERIDLDETEKLYFLRDMLSLSPKERNQLIEKLWRSPE